MGSSSCKTLFRRWRYFVCFQCRPHPDVRGIVGLEYSEAAVLMGSRPLESLTGEMRGWVMERLCLAGVRRGGFRGRERPDGGGDIIGVGSHGIR